MAKTVLVVDDDEHLREILTAMLRFSGYEISEAATGTEAVNKAISEKPDLILLDIELPDIRGPDVARAIRNNPASAHIPIIGCSAFFGWEYRKEALEAGMDDYLVKPISLEVIKTKIEEFILTERYAR
jgi:CheY-like chemotaxis protein